MPSTTARFAARRDRRVCSLEITVDRSGVSGKVAQERVVLAHVGPGELFDFDCFLGYLAAGDRVRLEAVPLGCNLISARTD